MAEQNIAQSKMFSNLFLAVSFVVVLIVLVGLMSALIMNILDRTREIGMLRCIGALSKDIRRVFSSEGLFLAVIGWIIGIPLGYGISKILGQTAERSMKLTFPDVFPVEYVAWSFVFTIVGTLIIIYFPLRRASRLKPGDALRYE
jgi:putative ABC transport system permease protein